MTQPLVKEDVHKLVDSLPEGATWDDLNYLVYVRTAIERGLTSAREEPGTPVRELRKKYGLD